MAKEYQIDTNDQYESVYRDEKKAEASDAETKERKITGTISRRAYSGKDVERLDKKFGACWAEAAMASITLWTP